MHHHISTLTALGMQGGKDIHFNLLCLLQDQFNLKLEQRSRFAVDLLEAWADNYIKQLSSA